MRHRPDVRRHPHRAVAQIRMVRPRVVAARNLRAQHHRRRPNYGRSRFSLYSHDSVANRRAGPRPHRWSGMAGAGGVPDGAVQKRLFRAAVALLAIPTPRFGIGRATRSLVDPADDPGRVREPRLYACAEADVFRSYPVRNMGWRRGPVAPTGFRARAIRSVSHWCSRERCSPRRCS